MKRAFHECPVLQVGATGIKKEEEKEDDDDDDDDYYYSLLGYHSSLSHSIVQLHMTCIRPDTWFGCEAWTYTHKNQR
jgi:hypothetical protein